MAGCLLVGFVLWTVLVRYVDVQPIGPRGSSVGFASVNRAVHEWTGVHTWLYTVTDWLGLVPIAVALGFSVFGMVQWIRRKRFLSVDRSLFALGGFYLAVMTVYVFFELFVVNYRPVLINGHLEASYPSSTTLLVLCVMPTAMMQLSSRIIGQGIKRGVTVMMSVFVGFMVIGRLVSGVHWVTDIIGGALLAFGLVMLYRAVAESD